MNHPSLAFIDLDAQRRRISDRLESAIARVLERGDFIMGTEVIELEKRLAAYCGAKHCLTCANGTDALQLVMMAEKIGTGDAVFVPAFTFVATAEVVPETGATPFFVDVTHDTFTMDVHSLESAVRSAKKQGLKPRLVIAVDLFGQPADYDAINVIANREGMLVVADSAQAFGASRHNCKTGNMATWTTTSFFPAKPLGCYGDGGALFTNDDERAELIRSLRVHGKGADKYENVRIGINSRLDTLQAAILLEKLEIFPDEIVARQRVAERYNKGLSGVVQVPFVPDGVISTWAQYTVVVPCRDKIIAFCKKSGIPTAVYYPIPLHKQSGYKQYPTAPGGSPVAEHLSSNVMSLPMHPYLDVSTQDRIISTVRAAIQSLE